MVLTWPSYLPGAVPVLQVFDSVYEIAEQAQTEINNGVPPLLLGCIGLW